MSSDKAPEKIEVTAEYLDDVRQLTRLELKKDAIVIIRRHLDSITEARKDTTGLGMSQHIIKMILAEVSNL